MDITLLVSAFVVDIAVVTAAAVVVIVVVLAVVFLMVVLLVAVVDCVVKGSETWFFLDQASFEKT